MGTGVVRGVCAGIVLVAASGALGSILYEDLMYWLPDGSTHINPAEPPTNALVKIQETVYDDEQGRQIVKQLLQFGLIHGDAVPGYDLNLYHYTITNMGYANGSSGDGAGVTGFDVTDVADIGGPQWGPNAANNWWHVASGHNGPGYYEWNIDKDADGDDGDGFGVLQGQTFGSFYLAVPDGTTHGFVDASINTWSGGGALEESSGATRIDFAYGLVSGPVPEPASLALLLLGGILIRARRR